MTTQRLRLRPFRPEDADDFVELAGDFAVARMTSDIPHPLAVEDARRWVVPGEGELRLAIERDGRLIGGVGYYLRAQRVGELGFWLGRNHWGAGLATEAGRAMVRLAFESEGLDSLSSCHFDDNRASARVLGKLGFTRIGGGAVWCEARGREIPSQTYWLDSATRAGGRARGLTAGRPPVWSERVARLLRRGR